MLSGDILNSRLKNLALFDFCETLVSFQTADAFVDFVRSIDGNFFMKLLNAVSIGLQKTRITLILNKFFPDVSLEKKLKLFQLRGFTYNRLNNLSEQYYREMIKPNLIDVMVDEMKVLAEQNYEICIVSAGYSIYLKYFVEEYHIKHLISSEIAFSKSGTLCRGIISGRDCISKEKVNRVMKFFNGQDINFNESIAYSDSIKDLPILLLAGKGVVVSKANSQKWFNKYQFREIIWP
jgi:HAD superfamily hydrolase (TIGR01490 family)